MPKPLAVLSYTRKDDAFFGGYITQFRTMLENAVHVVSGEESFRVFQDVEGIVIGESWQKKLTEVIHESSFFVPMLSPLFFNSRPCREETGQFLEHERTLGRDDLILPIYFLTTAKLEKEDEKAKDALATEIAGRQMFDWREQANAPLGGHAAREAVMTLARGIEGAIGRLAGEEPEALRGQRRGGGRGGVRGAAVPPGRAGRGVRGGGPPARGTESADPRLIEGVATGVRREEPDPRTVLWVDDNPDNNIWERGALESYGVRFLLARDTDQAERLWREQGPFAAVVSDMGRAGDRKAGLTLLSRLRDGGVRAPYFIYTTRAATRRWPEARRLGAQGLTADPDDLVEMVVAATR